MLKQMNIKFLPNGKRQIFSIKFIDAKGKLHYFPQAFATGLRYSLRQYRQQGIHPCDCKGNPEFHIYPVSIDAIVMYNNLEVIL